MRAAGEHIDAFFAAWDTHDPVAMGRFYSDDAVMDDPTLTEPRRGRAAIVRYYAEMFSSLRNPYHDLQDWAARDDRIWFEWTFGSGGQQASHEHYHGVSIQSFVDGLIIHDKAFWVPRG